MMDENRLAEIKKRCDAATDALYIEYKREGQDLLYDFYQKDGPDLLAEVRRLQAQIDGGFHEEIDSLRDNLATVMLESSKEIDKLKAKLAAAEKVIRHEIDLCTCIMIKNGPCNKCIRLHESLNVLNAGE